MRLLDRYLLKELLIPLGYCLSGFLVFWVSFDLFSELSRFQEHGMGVGDVATYYLAKLPAIVVLILPIALLLASLYALTHHARHHELIAMRSAGVGVWRLSLPYLSVGLVLSSAVLCLNECFVPGGETQADEILVRSPNSPAATRPPLKFKVNFSNDKDGRIWNIQQYNLITSEMVRPHVEWRLPDGTRQKIIAEHGIWTNGIWTFFAVQKFVVPPVKSGKDEAASPSDLPESMELVELECPEFSETPDQILSEIRISSLNNFRESKKAHLSLRELWEYRRWHPQMRPDKRAVIDTLLHTHLAAPWTCFVVVLIALPFGLVSSRRNVFVGVASSIVICFAYFVLSELCQALGAGGYLIPMLAVWMPNLFFGAAGFVATQRLS